MNRAETVQLLTYIAAIDGRRLDEAVVIAWQEVIGDLPLDECQPAARAHFAKSGDWLMPHHIRDRVLAARETQRPRSEWLSLPSRYEADPDRDDRTRRGLARVAAALSVARDSRPRAIEATEKPSPSQSELIRARAIQRAVADRGGTRLALETPPLRDRRPRVPNDYGAVAFPDLGPTKTCSLCKAAYTEDPAGYAAHRTVHLHTPEEAA